MNEVSTDVIRKELIIINSDLKSRDEIINTITEAASKLDLINDEKEYFDAVIRREDEISTAIGFDIAIPHGKTDVVTKPFIAFCRLNEKIHWASPDDELVQMIFQIGVPESNSGNLHLKFISEISKMLIDEAFREKLLVAKNADEIYNLLTQSK
ncbi:PTS sugar transporter subunit IIA [Macrococcus animalis]|uniref:PTS sugar transporter subunit IIA n=1 Tax=Macrococcus animalis TaxID=3395467 RepID=UPI0039BE3C23